MQTTVKKRSFFIALGIMLAGYGYAGNTNRNPASIGYVDEAVEAMLQRATYMPGTAISIVNNVISGAYKAGTGINISGDTISANTYSIGDIYEGAIVFYVDGTKQHGLAYRSNNEGNAGLSNSATLTNVSAAGSGVGTGVQNTAIWNAALITSRSLSGASPATNDNGAAQIAVVYSVESDGTTCPAPSTTSNPNICFGGFYLPSLVELELLIQSGLLNTPSGTWWTSTSDPSTPGNAFAINKGAGTDTYTIDSRNVTSNLLVLPIRQF